MLTAGLTTTVAPLLMPFSGKLVVPSVYTMLKVPGVGNVKVKVTGEPEQIEPLPEIDAVGSGFTITATDAPKLVAVQVVLSVSAVTL